MRTLLDGHPLWVMFSLMAAICLGLGCKPGTSDDAYIDEIQEWRRKRDLEFRTHPLSQLAFIHRQHLKNLPRTTLGSSSEADLYLKEEDITPVHAVIEGTTEAPVLKVVGEGVLWSLDEPPRRIIELTLIDMTGFRLGRFNLLYKLHRTWGRVIEVYDPIRPTFKEFTGMEYFSVDSSCRVTGRAVPEAGYKRVTLFDSQGNERLFWRYGELRFELQGTACTLDLFASSTDSEEIKREGFMLMFTDKTSGNESYPAARYLDIEGKLEGPVVVDFNKAYNPPCNYSSAFTCPFPGPRNRLPVPVRAGQKWYWRGSSKADGIGVSSGGT